MLPDPVVALGEQQALAKDRLQQAMRQHVGLISVSVGIDNVIDVTAVTQVEEATSKQAKRHAKIGVGICPESGEQVRPERLKKVQHSYTGDRFDARRHVGDDVRQRRDLASATRPNRPEAGASRDSMELRGRREGSTTKASGLRQ